MSEGGTLLLDVDQLEARGDSCRAYLVVSDPGDRHYNRHKVDLLEFHTDGILGARFATDLAPIRPEKTLVKLFDIAETRCDEIGSFPINDIIECRTESGQLDDCFSGLSVSSRADAGISK